MSAPGSFLPPAFQENMQVQLGADFPNFLAAHERPAPVSLRINPAKVAFLQTDLQRIPWSRYGYYLPERPVFTADPWLHAGGYYVQEASSMLLEQAFASIADLSKPLMALDLCAAPGGKSTHLLSLLHPDSLLVSNEVIQGRFPLLQENLVKWGAANSVLSNLDPEAFAQSGLQFDLVLVDAPCSGEGLFRKDPEACREWSPAQVTQCSARQQRILKCALDVLKPGGILVYSTCTYEEAENNEPLRTFEAEGLLEYIPLDLDSGWGFVARSGGYQAYPHKLRGEGFFMGCWRKMQETPISTDIRYREAAAALPAKAEAGFESWIEDVQTFRYFQDRQGRIRAIPASHWPAVQDLSTRMSIRQAGIEVGSMKGAELMPAHALALSTISHPGIPQIELTLQQARAYLRKDTFSAAYSQKGWARMCFSGLGLGWAKLLPGRINNYYPTDWRIRMGIDPAWRAIFTDAGN